nr:hypothetical protein [Tanacetum cinerariifolium]
KLHEVDFPLLAELSSYKDLTLLIYRPEDQVVLGETSLLFPLSISHYRVEKIRENVTVQRSALIDVWIKEFQDAQMNIVNYKVAKLDADLLDMALHLKEKFYPHLFTTIFGRRWLLTHGLKLVVVKCLNSPEYLMALGSAISYAIKKGMQNGLSASIDHKNAGRSLADLLTLTLLIHRPEDQVVLGETSLLFSLSISHYRVEKIRENVAVQRSALIDVWVPLVDPLSAENLIGAASTFGSVLATIVTKTTLSTTFASTSCVPPITTDDYEIVSVDGQEDAQGNVQGNVASFPTVEFEKEELDTTLKRDPPN